MYVLPKRCHLLASAHGAQSKYSSIAKSTDGTSGRGRLPTLVMTRVVWSTLGGGQTEQRGSVKEREVRYAAELTLARCKRHRVAVNRTCAMSVD
jgi:hypothetical protein